MLTQADIPYAHMWPDDRVWLPRLLRGEALCCEFLFDRSGNILQHTDPAVQ